MRSSKFKLISAATLICGLALVLIFLDSDLEQQELNKVRLQLQWWPTSQFLGVYVAEERGYYVDEQLDVSIMHGGPNIDPLRRLNDGDADIAFSTADQVVLRDSQSMLDDGIQPIHALGTIFSRNLAVFMYHPDSSINGPTDLMGKSVGVYPNFDTDHILRIMLEKLNLDIQNVSIVPYPQLGNWFDRRLDVFPAYLINEPVEAAFSNVPYELLDPESLGIDFYSDTIVTTQQYLHSHEEAVLRFISATARGWDWAKANPDEAVNIMVERERAVILGRGGQREIDKEYLKAVRVLEYLNLNGEKAFEIDQDRWNSMVSDLKKIGVVDETYKPEKLIYSVVTSD